MNSESRTRQQNGFTLIEVLVALAVVVVSFVALYAVILQMVRATSLMQDKTIASWIAFDQITELRVANKYPGAGNSEGDVEMAGSVWLYRVEIKSTESEDVRQVIVRVSPEREPDTFLGLVSGVLVRNPAAAAGPNQPGQPGPGGFDPNAIPNQNDRELD